MVIIEVRTSSGVVGRCDANCYNATGDRCTCICGGVNHGVGLKVALEDRHYIPDDEILAACKNLLPTDKYFIHKPQIQNTLYGEPEPVDKKALDIAKDSR